MGQLQHSPDRRHARYIAERGWLTVCRLPPCALDLDPVEGMWSGLRRTPLADRAFADSQDLINAVRRGLRQLRYRHDVLDGCLVGTGPVSPHPPLRHHAIKVSSYQA
ncbi:hypothetical protein [Streptomyces sp. NPDC006527]|uniref:hypothetical protein n=1 Tax=Streptomyces sp. NPDC006527 TaxID=3364749 RepID=UPI003673FCB6